MIYDKVETDIG
jgi:hypothetical protein